MKFLSNCGLCGYKVGGTALTNYELLRACVSQFAHNLNGRVSWYDAGDDEWPWDDASWPDGQHALPTSRGEQTHAASYTPSQRLIMLPEDQGCSPAEDLRGTLGPPVRQSCERGGV